MLEHEINRCLNALNESVSFGITVIGYVKASEYVKMVIAVWTHPKIRRIPNFKIAEKTAADIPSNVQPFTSMCHKECIKLQPVKSRYNMPVGEDICVSVKNISVVVDGV
ncbi:hypothetical protein EVAR_62640_1 [Eumeta japonica]|uniref:Uncharacterized protein n=1 Tax=Eumeta variegata TaxID=151549 RepID=A0A4C2AI71_EUMVA|nr:hypothetical protein EVAR_62640_1 [Eumeta japonica]